STLPLFVALKINTAMAVREPWMLTNKRPPVPGEYCFFPQSVIMSAQLDRARKPNLGEALAMSRHFDLLRLGLTFKSSQTYDKLKLVLIATHKKLPDRWFATKVAVLNSISFGLIVGWVTYVDARLTTRFMYGARHYNGGYAISALGSMLI